MSEDPSYLRLGFVIAVLGMAGISDWVVQERSQSTALTKNVAEASCPGYAEAGSEPTTGQRVLSSGRRSLSRSGCREQIPPPEPPAREEKPLDKPTAASPTKRQTFRKVPLQSWLQRLQQANPKSQLRSRLRGISFRNQPKRQHLLRRRPVL